MEPGDLEPRVNALENQVRDLQAQVHSNQQDANAARILAGAADRDVSEFKGEMRELRQEMRDGFAGLQTELKGEIAGLRTELKGDFADVRTELKGEIADVRTELGELRTDQLSFRQATTASFNAQRQDYIDLRNHMNKQFANVTTGFIEMRGRLDAAAAGQQHIVTLLTTLIEDQGPGTSK